MELTLSPALLVALVSSLHLLPKITTVLQLTLVIHPPISMVGTLVVVVVVVGKLLTTLA